MEFPAQEGGEQTSVKGNIPVDRLKGNCWSEESVSRAVEAKEWLEVSLFREHGLLCPRYYNPSLEHHGHFSLQEVTEEWLLCFYRIISFLEYLVHSEGSDVGNRKLFRTNTLAQEKFLRKGLGKVLWVLREMLDHFFGCLFGDYSLMSTHQAIG